MKTREEGALINRLLFYGKNYFEDQKMQTGKLEWQNNYFKIIGGPHSLFLYEKYGGAIIVPSFENEVLFLQIKRNDGLVHLEFPRGFGEKGETSEETAKRELKEETNLDCIAIQELGIVMPDSGLIDAKIPIFEIEVNDFNNIILQKSEKIFGYETADRRILRSLILDKSIVDGYMLAGCLYLNI